MAGSRSRGGTRGRARGTAKGSAGRAESQVTLKRLRRDALILARAFRLPLRSVDAERANVKRRYGVCYDDGSIRIRLRHVRTRELLKYSALVDTLCHELAHLRHFDHGPRFHELYRRILSHARRLGVYRPAPRGAGSGRPLAGETGLVLRGSSILPLARLEPRRTQRPGAGPTRAGQGAAAAQGAGAAQHERVARGLGGRRRPRPEQLELFR